jgi:Na+/H+-dicarboxylate symporter
MKTWLTYLAAAAIGLAFQVNFKESSFFYSAMNFMANVTLKMGIFMVFPLVLVTMTSGTASLTRKKGTNGFVWLSTIFWSLLTTVLLSVAAALIFTAFPVAFPSTSSSSTTAEKAAQMVSALSQSTVSKLSSANPLSVNLFLNLIKTSDCLIPIILVALVMGYALRPTNEAIRPAYMVLNSLSEVMFRLVKKISQFMWIAIFFIAGTWYETLWSDRTIFHSWRWVVMFCIVGFGVLLIIIPLIYAIATGFKRNPYTQIRRLLSASTAALFSVNYMFSIPALYTDCRINLGIQKRVVATALPLHSVITKGGSAMIGTLCSCSLVMAVCGRMPTTTEVITIALACTIVSFVSCLHAGYEVLFCSAMAMNLINSDATNMAVSILGVLPMMNGIALLFDTLLAGLGTSFTAVHLGADCNVREKDIV